MTRQRGHVARRLRLQVSVALVRSPPLSTRPACPEPVEGREFETSDWRAMGGKETFG